MQIQIDCEAEGQDLNVLFLGRKGRIRDDESGLLKKF